MKVGGRSFYTSNMFLLQHKYHLYANILRYMDKYLSIPSLAFQKIIYFVKQHSGSTDLKIKQVLRSTNLKICSNIDTIITRNSIYEHHKGYLFYRYNSAKVYIKYKHTHTHRIILTLLSTQLYVFVCVDNIFLNLYVKYVTLVYYLFIIFYLKNLVFNIILKH